MTFSARLFSGQTTWNCHSPASLSSTYTVVILLQKLRHFEIYLSYYSRYLHQAWKIVQYKKGNLCKKVGNHQSTSYTFMSLFQRKFKQLQSNVSNGTTHSCCGIRKHFLNLKETKYLTRYF